jgi:putative lipoprotein
MNTQKTKNNIQGEDDMKLSVIITAGMALALLACLQNPGEKTVTTPETEGKSVKTTLSGTNWLVEDIAGRGVVKNSQASIRFDEGGRASGSTGCNRFNGAVTIKGNTIKFGQMAITKRGCIPSLMDQELRFLKAIEEVSIFAMGKNGLLYLDGPNSEQLFRLSPMADPSQ